MRNATRFRPAKVRTAAGFLDQESGTVTIFAMVGFALCMVIAGLVFDVGRVMGIHTQIKSFADRIALSAAAELDGRPGALDRAVEAAVGDTSSVGEGKRFTLGADNTLEVRRMIFLSVLGPDPADPATPSPVAGDVQVARWTPGGLVPLGGRTVDEAARDARYVIVEPDAEREDYVLFPMMAWLVPGMESQAVVASQSVAGFRQNICNSPPLMLCNPAEASFAGAPFTYNRLEQIRGRIRAGSNTLVPGDIKLLNAPQGTGNTTQRRSMGQIEPNTFCSGDVIPVRDETNVQAIAEGLNTRFDLFSNGVFNNRNNGEYTPAPSAPQGYNRAVSGNSCNGAPPSDRSVSTPLPRDNCFMPNAAWPNGVAAAGTGCSTYLGRSISGNGAWDRVNYWNTNHPPGTPFPSTDANGVSRPLTQLSRYDFYRDEISRNLKAKPSEGTCSTNPANRPTNSLRDRRVIPIAIVNCRSVQTSGDRNVRVLAYAEAFLTEPVGRTGANGWWNGQATDVFLEIIGPPRKALPDTVLREYPVLVR